MEFRTFHFILFIETRYEHTLIFTKNKLQQINSIDSSKKCIIFFLNKFKNRETIH